MKGAENMTVSKNPTSLKLSMDVENGTNALGAMQTKSTSVGSVRLDAEAAKCLAVTEAIGELMSYAVTCKALFTDIRSPCDWIAVINGIIKNLHEFINGKVV